MSDPLVGNSREVRERIFLEQGGLDGVCDNWKRWTAPANSNWKNDRKQATFLKLVETNQVTPSADKASPTPKDNR